MENQSGDRGILGNYDDIEKVVVLERERILEYEYKGLSH